VELRALRKAASSIMTGPHIDGESLALDAVEEDGPYFLSAVSPV
jgi:hypothetical protein